MWLLLSGILKMWHYQTQHTEMAVHETHRTSLKHNPHQYTQPLETLVMQLRSRRHQCLRCHLLEEATLLNLVILLHSRPSHTIQPHHQLLNL